VSEKSLYSLRYIICYHSIAQSQKNYVNSSFLCAFCESLSILQSPVFSNAVKLKCRKWYFEEDDVCNRKKLEEL